MITRGIPTFYKGYRFRSRLEARWAAFFTALGWKWEYEPFDLDGWIPDFLIYGKGGDVLIEVKPITAYCRETALKIAKADEARDNRRIEINEDGEVLLVEPLQEIVLVGDGPFEPADRWNGTQIGWFIKEKWGAAEGDPCLLNKDMAIGFRAWEGSFTNRITGVYDGDHHLSPVDYNEMRLLWAQGCNSTQWHA